MSAQTVRPQSIHLYQAFIGRWQSANTLDHPGKVFKALQALPWQNLCQQGFDGVYLLGVFDNRGPVIVTNENGQDISGRSHRVPSIFAITDHQKVNPALGTLASLKTLIKFLHGSKLKVILDFVGNHTGQAHLWVTSHPDYYFSDANGFRTEFSGDVYKLNYDNEKVCAEMTAVLLSIAGWGADGVRCDMAHLVPHKFWQEAIAAVKTKYPNFIFIAEAYSASVFDQTTARQLISIGFDFVYHQALFENIIKVFKEGQPYSFIDDHLAYIRSDREYASHLLHYPANHDDDFPGTMADLGKVMADISTLPGSTLLYNGLLHGHLSRLAHHYLDILPDNQNEVIHPSISPVAPSISISSPPSIVIPPAAASSSSSDSYSSVIALDIGGSKIESALVDGKYQLNGLVKVPTTKSTFEDFVRQIRDIISGYLANYPEAGAIAIAIPGVLDNQGKTQFAGGNLPFLTGRNLKLELSQYFKLPITIENDAKCFTLGEVFMGAGQGQNTVVGITWGTGIGAGIVINGQIFRGAGAAGEIGHIPVTTSNLSIQCGCGKANCLEVYASGAAIVREYHGMGGSIATASVADIAHSQEVAAIAVIDQAVIFMAEIIVAVINCLDPDCIVIGGGLSQIDDQVFDKLRLLVANQEIRSMQQTIILKKQLQNGGLIGAAKLARG